MAYPTYRWYVTTEKKSIKIIMFNIVNQKLYYKIEKK